MKKLLPAVSILAIAVLLFLLWKKHNQPPTILKQYPFPENKGELQGSIERINKKIPQKLFPTPAKEKSQEVRIAKPKERVQVNPEDEIATHYQNSNGDLLITSVTVVDKMIIAHGDLIVGNIEDMDEFLERAELGDPIILPLPTLWEKATVPYEIDSGLQEEEIQSAIEEINKLTNVRWVKREGHKHYVRFKSGPLNCYSPLGRIGGEQHISLSPECKKGSIMHEMLHTMGLLHEQNRIDRDKYIKILWENIDSKNHLQFQKISNKLIKVEEHPFDFKSIMLYAQNAFSKYPGDFTIVKSDGDSYTPSRETLSNGDLKKLSSLYPKQ